jgi:hypothetical protein
LKYINCAPGALKLRPPVNAYRFGGSDIFAHYTR